MRATHCSSVGLVLALACAWVAALPAAAEDTGMFPVVRDGRWGYIDHAGTLVIPLQFEGVDDFHDGLAQVRIDGQSQIIDTTGAEVALPRFDIVGDFSEGLAAVNRGEVRDPKIGLLTSTGEWGFVDRSGKLAIPMQFTAADAFSEGWAAVKDAAGSGFIDRNGAMRLRTGFDVTWGFHEGLALLRQDGHMRYVDRAGKALPAPRLDDHQARSFSEGLAAVSVGGKWGYIDKSGALAITPQFLDATDFNEGLAAVRVSIDPATVPPCTTESSRRHGGDKYGYIDRSGKLVIAPQFEVAGPFSEGLAAVRACGHVDFIDATGKTVLATTFVEATPFRDGLSEVFTADQRGRLRGYIDRTGRLVWMPSQ